MARFLNENDYTVILRNEIKAILLEDYTDTKLFRAEDMAISQIENYLFGRYDTQQIFKSYDNLPSPDPRNAHIVMITIDCTIYHLYTSLAPNRIPSHRADRYQDVLNWLKDVAKGRVKAKLPLVKDNNGNEQISIKISSEHPNEVNRW